jgi:hypothetical protein
MMQVFNFVGSRILTGPMCSDLWVKERQVKERRGGIGAQYGMSVMQRWLLMHSIIKAGPETYMEDSR